MLQSNDNDMEVDINNSLLELLRSVKSLQEQRVMIYKSFEKYIIYKINFINFHLIFINRFNDIIK